MLVSDTKGNIHVINVNKNEKVGKIKIHDEEIINFKVSSSKNQIYTLDRNGVVKVTDFIKGEIQKVINLKNTKSQKKANFFHFDIDFNEKNIVFNKNLKIKTLNLENNKTEKVGVHSSEINSLNFSSDGKFVISMTSKDYFIYLWYKKNAEPLITLQKNSLTVSSEMKFIEKGVYHLFSYNKSTLYGYKLILEEIDPSVPVKSAFEVEFPEKNLIKSQMTFDKADNSKHPQSLFLIFGKAFNAHSLNTRVIKYSKSGRVFKEGGDSVLHITSKSNEEGQVKKGVNVNTVKIINEIQMGENYSPENGQSYVSTDAVNDAKKNLLSNEINLVDEKISLLNIIGNSIINNDSATFQWALDQKDSNLIESTVKKMDAELLKGFIAKLIEVFQSNAFFKRNILPWFQLLFKYHQIEIIKLPAKILINLRSIQTLIKNRTKNHDRLLEVSTKLESLINGFNLNNKKNEEKKGGEFVTYEPLLVYNESDSEEETKSKLKEQMKKGGIKKTSVAEFIQKKLNGTDDASGEMFEDDVEMEDLMDEDMAMEDEVVDENKMDVDASEEDERDENENEDE